MPFFFRKARRWKSSGSSATQQAAKSTPAIKGRMHDIGVTGVAPERRSPEYLAKFVVDEIARWSGPIKETGCRSIKRSPWKNCEVGRRLVRRLGHERQAKSAGWDLRDGAEATWRQSVAMAGVTKMSVVTLGLGPNDAVRHHSHRATWPVGRFSKRLLAQGGLPLPVIPILMMTAALASQSAFQIS